MADGSTAHYGWTLTQVGGSVNTWGPKVNNNFGSQDTDVYNAAINNAGILAPTTPTPAIGLPWLDISQSPHPFNYYDGTQWVQLFTLDSAAHSISVTAALPSQAGNAGKFLQTNGASTSWQTASFGAQSNLASASTTDLGSISSNNVNVTGTTTITSFGSSASTDSPLFLVTFNASLTLNYNATSLKLPGSASYTTAAGDYLFAEYLGSGNWQVPVIMPANGLPILTVPLTKGGTGATTQQGAANAILPPQIANSGKFLTTDATNASWIGIFASTANTQAGSSTTAAVTPGGLKGAIGFSNYFQSSDQAITAGGSLTLAHGLGTIPISFQYFLVCQSGEGGFTTGDVTPVSPQFISGSNIFGISMVPDSTNLNVRYSSVSNVFILVNKSNGNEFQITPANWKLRIRAWG